jgi:hypothetical protein
MLQAAALTLQRAQARIQAKVWATQVSVFEEDAIKKHVKPAKLETGRKQLQ